jgi:hypothetical protein
MQQQMQVLRLRASRSAQDDRKKSKGKSGFFAALRMTKSLGSGIATSRFPAGMTEGKANAKAGSSLRSE